MNLMPQEVEYTSKASRASVYTKINEALYDWYVLASSNNIIFPGSTTGKQSTYNNCCNMIIFMLCHCEMDYSEIQ